MHLTMSKHGITTHTPIITDSDLRTKLKTLDEMSKSLYL